jgi:SAM-dependent methyltransferase
MPRFPSLSLLNRARQMKKVLRRLTSGCLCPVCERRVENFAPVPAAFTENFEKYNYRFRNVPSETYNVSAYSCPRCNATDRDRLFALYLRRALPYRSLRADFSLLDIAPSKALSRYIKKNHQIVYRTADLMMKWVDDCVDITDMKMYSDTRFNAFICSHVLEHVSDDIKAMKELYRILKPGGWGITMVPIKANLEKVYEDRTKTTEAERWEHFGQGDHLRVYSRLGFIDRLQCVGFSVETIEMAYFGEADFKRCGISPNSVLYISHKPQ